VPKSRLKNEKNSISVGSKDAQLPSGSTTTSRTQKETLRSRVSRESSKRSTINLAERIKRIVTISSLLILAVFSSCLLHYQSAEEKKAGTPSVQTPQFLSYKATSEIANWLSVNTKSLMYPFLLTEITLDSCWFVYSLILWIVHHKKGEEWISVLDIISLVIRLALFLKRLIEDLSLFVFAIVICRTLLYSLNVTF